MKKIFLLILLMAICLPFVSLAADEETFITREEFVKELLVNSKIEVKEVSESTFTDVVNPEYISFIEAAYNNGIASGYNGLFNPEREITKEEAIIMIVRVFGNGFNPQVISQEDIDGLLNFTDNNSISPWAKPYVAYALDTGLIKESDNSFYSQKLLSKEEASNLIAGAKATYNELFTRNGLSASEMLVLANDKNYEYETYKQKGSMQMDLNMEVSGISEEESIEEVPQQNIVMDIELDAQIENPDKAYIKEIIIADNQEGIENQEIEIFMDGNVMYTKVLGVDKWIRQDMSNIMAQIQSLSNSEPYKVSQLSSQQLEFLKKHAKFEEDVEIENKYYYVIAIDLDKEEYKKFIMENMEDVLDSIVELQANNPELNENPDFNKEEYEAMMKKILKQMETEVEYKFYINKDTMDYEKMFIAQKVYVIMNDIVQLSEEINDETQNISIKMVTETVGEIDFYDFNGEVEFPEINPEDILDDSGQW